MIRTCPLMGYTYSRLGATLGSPKLRLLSLLPHFCPFSPLYQSRELSLNLFLFPCVLLRAAPLPTARRSCPSSILSPSVFARTLGRSPFSQETIPQSPFAGISITPVTHVAPLRGASTLAVTATMRRVKSIRIWSAE